VIRMNKLLVIIGSSLAAIALLAFASGEIQWGRGGPSGVALDSAQSAVATSQGVTIRAKSAGFSGSATVVELEVDVSAATALTFEPLVASIPQTGIQTNGTLAPLSDSRVSLRTSGRGVGYLRFTEVVRPGDALEVVVTAIDFYDAAGRSVRIAGEWRIPLDSPRNLTRALRTEELEAAGPATDGGITVTVLGALRSSSETLVTFSIEPAGALHVGQPILEAGGKPLRGEQVESREDGTVVTYSFPATPFGQTVRLSVGPFSIRQQGGSAQRVSFDLGGVISRNALAAFGQTAAVEPVDIVEGAPGAITEVDLAGSAAGRVDVLGVTVKGNWDKAPETVLLLSNGEQLKVAGDSSWYRVDGTGTVTEGATRFQFPFDNLSSLAGAATLIVVPEDQLARGNWTIELSPRP
jgi:hypothetical protein